MQSNPFESLNFDQRPKFQPSPRMIFLVGTVIVYFIAWRVIPDTTLFWLGLPLIVSLAWVASHGWRDALQAIHRLIHTLELL